MTYSSVNIAKFISYNKKIGHLHLKIWISLIRYRGPAVRRTCGL